MRIIAVVACLALFACSQPASTPPRQEPREQPPADPAPEPEATARPEPEAPEQQPPPEAGRGPRCSEHRDCVVVNGLCHLQAAHRDVAAEVDERGPACAGRIEPVRAQCLGHCTAQPLDHLEWRACRRDQDCTVEERDCQWYEGVAVEHASEARAAFTTMGPCPGISPMPPEVSCVYGWCITAWAGER